MIACNLGNVPPDAFAAIVAGGTVSSEQLWAALIQAGYLRTTDVPAGTWISEQFQPYQPGFQLTLPAPFDSYAAPACALLTQACLTSRIDTDRYGRVMAWADPRLFLSNVATGTDYANFRYAYPMASNQAACTDSADAGARRCSVPRWIRPCWPGTAWAGSSARPSTACSACCAPRSPKPTARSGSARS